MSYETPALHVYVFLAGDVITTSINDGEIELPKQEFSW